MRSAYALCLMMGVGCALGSLAAEMKPLPTKAEMAVARDWVAKSFVRAKKGQAPPLSFVYDGKRSNDLLPGWSFKESTRKLDESRRQRTQTYTDPATGLQICVTLVQYKDFPTIEWTAHLKNTGIKDTPILENLRALDVHFHRGLNAGEFVLHHNRGAPNTPRDYEPFTTELGPGAEKRITGAGGRPTNSDLCYFNLEWGSQGVIMALGWPGQIATGFTRDSADGVRIVSGQELTHFKLLPGEEVRTPLAVLQFWQGTSFNGAQNVVRAQNIWRRWMIAHNLPRPGGKPMPNIFSTGATGLFPNYVGTQEEELAVLRTWARRAPQVDCWWVDAGWYPCNGDWWNTGTWKPDPTRLPGGLKAISDAAHASGMKFLVWFEPERAAPGSWLYENRPRWLLGKEGRSKLLDLGNAEAWRWIVGHLDSLITSQGIDIYRQDFNLDPLDAWRANDAEDRQGITENKHVQGLLALWDELKRRHPDMAFDECASGGRRNDLEMMRRGVPISKSDYAGPAGPFQCQFYGIASWLPYFGAGAPMDHPYGFRSSYAPWTATLVDTRDESKDLSLVHQAVAEACKVRPYFFGDFYPLTAYSLEESVWIAWQFDLPEQSKGMVQAFRRPENAEESKTFKLHNLDPRATYELTDFDSASARKMTGRDLMEKGLTIVTKQKPWASIITYRMITQKRANSEAR
jgi:alpha-galactosidase